MNTIFKKARRYHWYLEIINDTTIRIHQRIQSEMIIPKVFNLTAKKVFFIRQRITAFTTDKKTPQYELKRLIKKTNEREHQLALLNLSNRDFILRKMLMKLLHPI